MELLGLIKELFPTVDETVIFEPRTTNNQGECIYTRGLLYNFYKLVRKSLREAAFIASKSSAKPPHPTTSNVEDNVNYF